MALKHSPLKLKGQAAWRFISQPSEHLQTLNLKPEPQPSTLKPQPSTLNPQPSTHNPQTSTFNHQPSTLNPQPSTQPSPLNLNT